MKHRTLFVALLVLMMAAVIFTGCQKEEPTATKAPAPAETEADKPTETAEAAPEALAETELEGTLSLSGSTSVLPLAEKLAEAFIEVNPKVNVEVQGGGSSQGVKDAVAGVSDIGNCSRNLKSSEKEENPTIKDHVIAYDGIAVAVHPTNAVSDLTMDQITQIYKGEITNWSEVGGADAQINVYTREAASGTRGAFVELLELQEKDADGNKIQLTTEAALESNSNGNLKTNVANDPNAIGYISMGSIDDTIKPLKVGGVEPSVENVKSGDFKISRPFLMVTIGEPEGLAKAFLDFVSSNAGQDLSASEWIDVR